jgi:2-phosphoglycolate phosphatase
VSKPTSRQSVRAVLFDLDGTLADTAPDLAYALNQVRVEQGLPPYPLIAIRPHVSHGSTALIQMGFGMDTEDPGFEPLRQRLLAVYRDNIAVHTALFPQMEELLLTLEQRGIQWGVVTNKPAFLTDPLIEALSLNRRATCIGDTTAQRKPHPMSLLHACALAGCEPQHCLYVGDAERDIEAGRRAGMTTLVALFGYLREHDTPAQWGANGMIDAPLDILQWLPDA